MPPACTSQCGKKDSTGKALAKQGWPKFFTQNIILTHTHLTMWRSMCDWLHFITETCCKSCMWFICPHYLITPKQFAQPHYIIHQNYSRLWFSPQLLCPWKSIYMHLRWLPQEYTIWGAPWHASKTLPGCTQCNSSIHSCQSGFSHDQHQLTDSLQVCMNVMLGVKCHQIGPALQHAEKDGSWLKWSL